MPPHLPPFSRRHCLQGMLACALMPLLSACTPTTPLLRLGSNGWPGYLFIEWAAQSGRLPASQLRVIRFPSATLVMQGLAASMLEAACLTLDEVLTMRAEGVPLQVVAVLDVSAGADMLLVHDGIQTLPQLAGKRIGVEQSAVGAIMLEAILQRAGLRPSDITLVPLLLNQHEQAFASGRVDAIITFAPHSSRLLAAGANLLFSSMSIPGRIVDVLAVRSDVLAVQRDNLQRMLDAHFQLLSAFGQQDKQTLAGLASLTGLPDASAAQVRSLFWGMHLPDRQENLEWFSGSSPRLLQSARQLQQLMQQRGLLRSQSSLDDLLHPLLQEGGA